MNNKSDDLQRRIKITAIDMDEEIEPYHRQDEDYQNEDRPAFTLGMKLTTTNGKERSYKVSLEDPDDKAYYLTNSPDDLSFTAAVRWLNVVALAGALTFSDPEESILFIDPLSSWADLYFKQLPLVAAHAELGQFLWRKYSSIEVWLRDEATGEFVSKLRLVDPETGDSG